MTTATQRPPQSPNGDPVWELAALFPPQGEWTEQDYFALDRLGTTRLIEFVDGRVEFLPMPSIAHQRMSMFLVRLLLALLDRGVPGEVLTAPTRLRIPNGHLREPDILYRAATHAEGDTDQYWVTADIVIEIVSPGEDFVDKRADYALAGVGEYWIVDPEAREIHVLAQRDGNYETLATARAGETARSATLPGFEVDLTALFALAQ